MVTNTSINREIIRKIAFAPGEMNDQEVFVGGATLGMYINDQNIQILPLPYFLASKFSAFHDRGAKDPGTSHDFEDIVEQLAKVPDDLRPYLGEQLQRILDDKVMQETIFGNLFYETREERYQRIIECIKQIIDGI